MKKMLLLDGALLCVEVLKETEFGTIVLKEDSERIVVDNNELLDSSSIAVTKAKIFNLTTLRKHGWEFDDDGALRKGMYFLSEESLNIIDRELDILQIGEDLMVYRYDDGDGYLYGELDLCLRKDLYKMI